MARFSVQVILTEREHVFSRRRACEPIEVLYKTRHRVGI